MPWSRGQTRTSTAAHKAWARQVLTNAAGWCQIQGPGCTGTAGHADHIVPVAEGGAEHDPANGQGACTVCHDAKTKTEIQRGRARYYGAAKRQPERHPGLS
ncbi:HNH endonuclease [Nocardioides bruguierae]|uniref:HNH endonuclease n=1 Tax=Nocardioides bruguierae TaxID=2945102 RepID=A0A9X2DAR5_9ACTN|nr:HNH endonuclease [Nocardioides bruguierae]MCM0622498.1 HNH endonuclease [Nocardioides bruguierae]